MGVSDLHSDKNAASAAFLLQGTVLDLSSQGMQKLDSNFMCPDDAHTLILDGNHIMKLEHLERSPGLQQLSVAGNRLVRMMGVCQLTQLRILNLPNNSIGYIEGLRDLPHLEWLNLSGNNIKVIEQLSNCVSLQHLDLSDNNISTIGDLTPLVALKILLLHGNSITTLRTIPAHLPANLSILSLAENEIRDMNEVSYLASLHNMEQLSIMNNPCIITTPALPGFDYRPYVISWCLNLKVLDGYVVTQKEGLKAEWLYSHGKGRSYRPGQHVPLVQYLATVCPLTSSPALETAEDAKLEKILSKQRLHQRQLLEQTQGGCPNLPRPTQLDVKSHSPSHALPQGAARDERKICPPEPAPAAVPSVQNTEPVMQFNTWVGCNPSHPSRPIIYNPRVKEAQIFLEEITDEDKLTGDMLSAESTLLPFTSDPEPRITQSDSEDETETFEPDSLAPKWPAPDRTLTNTVAGHSPTTDMEESCLEEHIFSGVPSQEVRSSTPKSYLEANPDKFITGMETPKQEQVCASKPSLTEAHKAAVKIQSWWRGQYTRCCHPMAREVRSEIRLHRMQEHILSLSEKLDRMQQRYEEERLQRLVQEEAIKFLWMQFQSMQQWKQSVEQQLSHITQAATPAQISNAALLEAAPPAVLPAAASMKIPPSTDVSFPDSGFQSSSGQQSVQDSFLSSGTTDSLKTVRELSPVQCGSIGESNGVDSEDCSLLEKYLSSIQQREEEAEEVMSDRTETPRSSSPLSPSETTMSNSPQQKVADNQSTERTGETTPDPI